MSPDDIFLGKLCAWRENRGGRTPGMQSVLNVLENRAARDGTNIYAEATKRLQFSSLTAAGDAELILWAPETDPQWIEVGALAAQLAAGSLPDITGGAVDYYAPGSIVTEQGRTFTLPDGTVIPFPDDWNAGAVAYTVTIANQVFFKGV
jgi:hypothetical protein